MSATAAAPQVVRPPTLENKKWFRALAAGGRAAQDPAVFWQAFTDPALRSPSFLL